MRTRFTHWYNYAMLAGACFMWACQEPSKQETKTEEPVIEEVQPSAAPVSTPVEPPKQEVIQPEPKKEEPVKKVEEKKSVVKTEKPKKEAEEIVVVADQPAEPASGYPSYYRYIKTSLQYPDEAKKHNAEGQVFVEFVVKKDGSVEDVRVQPGKGIGYGCDEEAIRVVKQGEKWKPAVNKGEAVAQRITLPIKFKLN